MNLPLKLVDLVTLLFCSLLVVIIVFIILQRNIKRFKLRNYKDSHYIKCKSIPQYLKDEIEKKHIISHSYKEPPQLLAESHLNEPDTKNKNYVYRMKAFEVSKSLENALAECGYFRGMSKKLEDYINDDILDPSCDDKALPKTLLNDFVDLYLWAMHDPIPFNREKLRKLNQLINKIITILAFNKTDKHDQIIKHKLDLDTTGDFDFNLLFSNKNQNPSRSYSNINNTNVTLAGDNLNIFEKKKLSRLQNKTGTSNQQHMPEVISMEDLNKDNGKLRKQKIVKNASTKSKKLFQTKSSKYEEIKDTSLPSDNSSFPTFMRKSKQNLNDTTESQINSDWMMTNDRNFDSENEEIPLVASKKTHQKKKSNLSNILIGAPSSKASSVVKSSPSNSIRLSKVSSNPCGNLQITNPIELGGMHENEGFNETIFD